MARTNKTKSKNKMPASHEVSPTFKDHFRVYFPSRETVLRSRGGIDVSRLYTSRCSSPPRHRGGLILMTNFQGAGTICFSSRNWDSPTFPSHDIFRDSENVRHGLLIHSKVMFVRRHASAPDSPIGWAYIGSANLSESAWSVSLPTPTHPCSPNGTPLRNILVFSALCKRRISPRKSP